MNVSLDQVRQIADKFARKQGPVACALVHDDIRPLELSIIGDLFARPKAQIENWYDFRIVACEQSPIQTRGCVAVSAAHDLDALGDADLIIIAGWPDPISDDLKQALVSANNRGARIAGIYTGAHVLAECGLLDGRDATTHWTLTESFQELYPKVNVQHNVLYVDDMDVLTSAGAAAAIDLCLHIIRKDYGSDIANLLAQELVVPAHREGKQNQFIARPVPKRRNNRVSRLLDRIRSELDGTWTLETMAKAADMSPRTVSRHMIEATGQSPQSWLVVTRIARAKELLESSDFTLQDITSACGFKSQESFRRHFRAQTGTSPAQYRKANRRNHAMPVDAAANTVELPERKTSNG